MNILRNPGWSVPCATITPETVYLQRRALLGGIAALPLLARGAAAQQAPRNSRYEPGRSLTAERDATTYNNYYEFGSGKTIWRAAQRLPQRPWTLKIEGMVESTCELDLDDLLQQVALEERVYRHRCVEAWAMTVPWSGFPMADLLRLARPLASARYVVFETIAAPDVMPGLRQSWYPWPYQEGVTLAEAANELAFIAVGLYGKPLPAQNGGPIRAVLPWKYGFKSCKSIVRMVLTDRRPVSFWEKLESSEYGFWANVNPAVRHPRWSQAYERLLGNDERVPTQIYNGYGAFVASLYADMPASEKLFM